MRPLLLGLGALLAVLPPVAVEAQRGAAAPASKAAQARDWSRSIVRTAAGGYRIGNPDAVVKVVEYVSLTCPGCAAFSAEGMPALLRDHVRPGRVSLELRHYPLNILDLAAAAAVRCATPAETVALSQRLLATQARWMDRFQSAPEADRRRVAAMPPTEALAAVVRMAGIGEAVMPALPADALARCLADQEALDALVAVRQRGDQDGVTGTPSFVVNGTLATGVHDWAALQPLLRPPAR